MGIVIKHRKNGCLLNWNCFDANSISNLTNFTGILNLYVDGFKKDETLDLKKAQLIKEIPGLEHIIISSTEYEAAAYFDELFPSVKKSFQLLNDLNYKNRSSINFSGLRYDTISVSVDYYMHIANRDEINRYFKCNMQNDGIVIADRELLISDIPVDKINSIIDEIFSGLNMEKLDDVDKSVLVSNWIQNHYQFVDGKNSESNGKIFVADNFDTYSDGNSVLQLVTAGYGVCGAFTALSALLLSNPRVGCKCSLACAPGHIYLVQTIDGKNYISDNTWCVTRNANRVDGHLKAASFSNEYLLIGQDKIYENDNTLANHTSTYEHLSREPIEIISIPRETIEQSVLKLYQMGVSFSYNTLPAISQYESGKKIK